MEKTRSPYQRYAKTPWRYSPELRAWREAVIKNHADEAARQHAIWERKWGPRQTYYRTLLAAE